MWKSDKSHRGIFGTPPEPLFRAAPEGMKPELLEECLSVLASENAKRADVHCKLKLRNLGHFKDGKAAETLFLVCDKLNLPVEAKYVAIELFDNFMQLHIQSLYEYVKTLDKSRRKPEWLAIQERVGRQILLRIISCCQLASKLTSHYKIISLSRVRRTLLEFGFKYNTESILQSELRVLKTMDYKIMFTSPLVYVETLLTTLGHNDSTLEVKLYHGVSLKILDLFYLERRTIYTKLFNVATGQNISSKTDMANFMAVECDMMLLGASVVASASYIMCPNDTDKVIDHLSLITRIPNEDILDFSTVLVQSILQDNEQ